MSDISIIGGGHASGKLVNNLHKLEFKGNINISNVSKLANLEQDEMLKIATWKNDSICPINEKILTDYIEFPVAYFGLDYHKLFGF